MNTLTNDQYSGCVDGSSRKPKRLTVNEIYSVVITLLPVLMMYKVPLLNIGLSTTLVVVFALYGLLLLVSRKGINCGYILCFAVYSIIAITRSVGNAERMILLAAVAVHMIVAAKGYLSIYLIRKTIEFISSVASVLLLIQLLAHLVGFDFSYLQPWMLIDNLSQGGYGLVRSGSLYRASSLFLEPSHFAQYVMFGLMSVTFPDNGSRINIKKAILFTVSIVGSTSGMGIVITVCIWWWYVFTRFRQKGGMKLIGGMIGGTLVIILIIAVLMLFTSFSSSVYRMFGMGGQENAFEGRTLYWSVYVKSLSGTDLLFGKGYMAFAKVGGYATALMELIYCYGLIVTMLFASSFLIPVFWGKAFTQCSCICFLGLMCIANNSGFMGVCFVLGSAYAYVAEQKRTITENAFSKMPSSS